MGLAALLGRRFGAALFASVLWAGSAQAATHTVGVRPTSARGNPVEGEAPVLTASAPLPRGEARVEDDFLTWAGGSDRCPSRVFFGASAAPAPVKLPGRIRRSKGSILLHTAGGDRRIAATALDGRGRKDLLDGATILQFRLPADLISTYPRRTVYVMAGPIPWLGRCPAAQERRSIRIARAAVRHAAVTVPATYTPPPPHNPPKPIDLAANPGLKLQQPPPPGAGKDIVGDPDLAAAAGSSEVSAAGDVNGDGLADAVVSMPYYGPHNRGVAAVVFGRHGGGTVQLGQVGTGGFRIVGPARDGYELPVAGIGDLDGDGLGDLVVGAPNAARGGGAAYVIRGQASTATVDLAKPGDRLLFKIAGGRPCRGHEPNQGGGDNIGGSVAGAGDVNGDGLPDVAVLAEGNCFSKGRSGAYVVFSARDGRTVDISHLGSRGIAIPADYGAELAGGHVRPAGDVNGDGLADVALSTGEAGLGVRMGGVILGRTSGATIRQSQLAYLVRRSSCEAAALTGAGDVNGDGIADLLLAGDKSCSEDGLGRAYVIFGSHSPQAIDTDALGDGGITITAPKGSQHFGAAVAAGDVNGDGLADVAIADDEADALGRGLAGEVFLIPGRREPGTVDLRYAGASVLAWAGPPGSAHLGSSLAGLGDFDGDGRPDLLASAPLVDGDTDGAAYVLPMP